MNYQNNNDLINSCPSLCIPRINNNTNKEDIINVIKRLHIGKISRIDIISKKNNSQQYNKAFIHFNHWYYSNNNVNQFKEKILNNETIKIVYDKPWYWKLSLSKFS